MVRQRSAKPLSAGSIPAVASRIALPPGFAFGATVESHGWYQLAPFRWSSDDQVLRRKEALTGGVVELEVEARRGALEIRGAPLTAELTQRIRRMLQLDVDVAEFVALTRTSPRHAWVEEGGFGRLLCGTTRWEDAVKIIATTNTTWRQTVRMIELLVAKCGRDGAFPAPADVVRFTAEELQEDCRLGYRATSVHRLATGIVDGTFDIEAEPEAAQTTAALFKAYQQLPGIGPYGAAHLLAMDGRHDHIAVDSEFRRFVRETYHGGRRVADVAMLKRYAKWGRWKYLAYWSELWSSVAAPLQPPRRKDKQSTLRGRKSEY